MRDTAAGVAGVAGSRLARSASIGLLLGNVDFSQMTWVLKAATGGDPKTEVAIRYGTFINLVIAFVVIALVVYGISTVFLRPAPEAPTKACPYCRETVPADATKCRACGSTLRDLQPVGRRRSRSAGAPRQRGTAASPRRLDGPVPPIGVVG